MNKSIQEVLFSIKEATNWNKKYLILINLGKKLSLVNLDKSYRILDTCISRSYISWNRLDNSIKLLSDSRVTAGIFYLIENYYNSFGADFCFLYDLHILENLTLRRRIAIENLISLLKQLDTHNNCL